MNLDKIKIDKSEIYFQFLKKSGRDFDIEKLIEIFGLPEKSFSKNPLDYYVKDLSEAFNGSIDEMKIYNKALNQNEIQILFNQIDIPPVNQGDLNEDLTVNVLDLVIVGKNLGPYTANI